jgi:hypothetical protein
MDDQTAAVDWSSREAESILQPLSGEAGAEVGMGVVQSFLYIRFENWSLSS